MRYRMIHGDCREVIPGVPPVDLVIGSPPFAMTLAQKRLNDLPYTLEISRRLASYEFPDMTGWIYLFPAIYLERMQRYDEARAEIARVLVSKRHRLSREHLMWAGEFTQGLAKPPQ